MLHPRRNAIALFCLFGWFLALTPPAWGAAPALSVPSQSKFIADLDVSTYPVVNGPGDPLPMKMDFSGNADYSYDFSQNIEGSHWDGLSDQTTGQEISVRGELLLKSQGDRTADLVLDASSVETTLVLQGEPRTMKQAVPPLVIPGILENGRINAETVSQDIVFQILFPLPDTPLRRGETFSRRAIAPFAIQGTTLSVTGEVVTTLSDFVLIDGALCAKLEGNILLTEVEVPKDLQGTFSGTAKGRLVAFFDLENRSFVECRIALLMAMSADMPNPDGEIPEKDRVGPAPKRTQVEMVNDNLVSYRRKNLAK